MSARAVSMVGVAVAVTRFGGPPAPTIARLIRRIVSAEQRRAPGCALNTTEFPAAQMFTMLPLNVGIECVLGVIAPTTPKGVYSSSVMP